MVCLCTLRTTALTTLLLCAPSAISAQGLDPWQNAQAVKEKERGAGCYELYGTTLRRSAVRLQEAMRRDRDDPAKAQCLALALERRRALFKTIRDDPHNWADACLALNRNYGVDRLPALCYRGGVDLGSALFDSTSWVCANTVCRNTSYPDWKTAPTTPSPDRDCLSDGWGAWACP